MVEFIFPAYYFPFFGEFYYSEVSYIKTEWKLKPINRTIKFILNLFEGEGGFPARILSTYN
jgi:hypothetical protein